MSKKIEDMLDEKVENEDKEKKTVKNENAETEKPKKEPDPQATAPQKVKDEKYDEEGRFIFKNAHHHNVAAALQETMMSHKHMQGIMGTMIKHMGKLTEQAQLHEKVLMKMIGEKGEPTKLPAKDKKAGKEV